VIASAHAYCAAQRMQPLRSFLDAVEAVLEGVGGYAQRTAVALRERVDWTSEAAEAQGPAAGCRAAQQALPSPLVQRLRLTADNEHGSHLLALATGTTLPAGAPLMRLAMLAADAS